MKCDPHVHSWHSGMCTTPLVGRVCRESYSKPEEVYAALKERGMDLVTLSDHDCVGSAEELRRYPDFFLSEEVTCRMPSGTVAHIGVYDITERQHIEIQRRRTDLGALLAYLTERRLLFSINHVFSSLTGRRKREDFDLFAEYFPAVETRSGQMLAAHNRYAQIFANCSGRAGLGESDSHALPSVGSAYTEVPGARSKDEFFQGVRAGRARAAGQQGGYFKLTRDVLWITASMMRERRWTTALAPLMMLVPIATLATLVEEMAFAWYWSRQVNTAGEVKARWFDATGNRGAEVPIWP